MNIFNFNRPIASNLKITNVDQAELVKTALNALTEGIIITTNTGIIKFLNPAAAIMTGYKTPDRATGLDCTLVLKLEHDNGNPVSEQENPIIIALKSNQNQTIATHKFRLISADADKRLAIALKIIPASSYSTDRIITFRDITKEIEEENAQMEFISTASHEMRTPIASIEGYLSLALNPQTATIDNRAKQYLLSAHDASEHLGHLFRDLLDVSKLEDKKLHPTFVPVELTTTLQSIATELAPKFAAKHIKYFFGNPALDPDKKTLNQILYCSVDVSFLREILNNLLENALKYTTEHGIVWIGTRSEGNRAIFNVTDNGIGIPANDLNHIFQKFYRVDNSQTRTIGGTGLGLYLVKERVEALNGKIWAESIYQQGSSFYVSLPRLSEEEYQKQILTMKNANLIQQFNYSLKQDSASPPT